jgi:Skp family chaperone for outer membrane proteins
MPWKGVEVMDEKKLQEIEERLNALNKRGLEGFSAREHFSLHAETDIDKLIAEVRRSKIIEVEYNKSFNLLQQENQRLNELCDMPIVKTLQENERLKNDNQKLTKQNNDFRKQIAEWNTSHSLLEIENQRYKQALESSKNVLEEVMNWYGQGLDVANWHMNGDFEALDNFIETAGIEETLGIVTKALKGEE